MRKLLLSTIIVGSIGIANAQWHFTADFKYNCSSAYYGSQINLAQQFSGMSFNSKQECESARQSITMNYSYGGCYLRITTSPCVGGNIGSSSGGDGSVFNSTGIGGAYFSPNEAKATSDYGRDTEIKLEAMNRNYNGAVNRGISTNYQSFDDTYQRQVGNLPKDVNDNDDTYTLRYRRETLGNESDSDRPMYVKLFDAPKLDDNTPRDIDGTVFPIDPERIKNQERDERLEKFQKEYEALLNSEGDEKGNKIFQDNQEGIVSLNIVESTTVYSASTASGIEADGQENVSKAESQKNMDYDEFETEPALFDNYKVGAMAVKTVSEELAMVPKTELLNELNDLNNGINDVNGIGKMLEKTALGDLKEAYVDYKQIIKEKFFNPTKDLVMDAANVVSNKLGINLKKGKEIIELNSEASKGFFKRILNYEARPTEKNRREIEKFQSKIEKRALKISRTRN